jgi:hypothetical protein
MDGWCIYSSFAPVRAVACQSPGLIQRARPSSCRTARTPYTLASRWACEPRSTVATSGPTSSAQAPTGTLPAELPAEPDRDRPFRTRTSWPVHHSPGKASGSPARPTPNAAVPHKDANFMTAVRDGAPSQSAPPWATPRLPATRSVIPVWHRERWVRRAASGALRPGKTAKPDSAVIAGRPPSGLSSA